MRMKLGDTKKVWNNILEENDYEKRAKQLIDKAEDGINRGGQISQDFLLWFGIAIWLFLAIIIAWGTYLTYYWAEYYR